MINLNSNWNREPFLLKPAGKDYLWGGNRLNEDFSKGIEMSPLAETWECSANMDGLSVIDSGVFKGLDLAYLLKIHPEFLGTHHEKKGNFPILVKLIDAKEDLSVQVHPDDEYALAHENALGKTEMWYVLAASKKGKLVFGFRHDMEKEMLKQSILDGTIEKHLQYIPVKKNDVFLVKPGTVHAICAGALIAEIQQNSNITYRLYDYNRIDKNGQKRELHIDKAMEVIDCLATPEPKQPIRLMQYGKGVASEIIGRCKYFQVDRLMINTEQNRSMLLMKTDELSFQVLLCVDGCGVISSERGDTPFFKGDCFFVPANSPEFKIHGITQILKVIC